MLFRDKRSKPWCGIWAGAEGITCPWDSYFRAKWPVPIRVKSRGLGSVACEVLIREPIFRWRQRRVVPFAQHPPLKRQFWLTGLRWWWRCRLWDLASEADALGFGGARTCGKNLKFFDSAPSAAVFRRFALTVIMVYTWLSSLTRALERF